MLIAVSGVRIFWWLCDIIAPFWGRAMCNFVALKLYSHEEMPLQCVVKVV